MKELIVMIVGAALGAVIVWGVVTPKNLEIQAVAKQQAEDLRAEVRNAEAATASATAGRIDADKRRAAAELEVATLKEAALEKEIKWKAEAEAMKRTIDGLRQTVSAPTVAASTPPAAPDAQTLMTHQTTIQAVPTPEMDAKRQRIAQIPEQIAAINAKEDGLNKQWESWQKAKRHTSTTDMPAQITECESQIAALKEEAANLQDDINRGR